MNTPTTNYIEIDGEGKYIEDTDCREMAAQNANAIQTINGLIPSGTTANNKLVNASQLSDAIGQNTISTRVFSTELTAFAPYTTKSITIPHTQGKKVVGIGAIVAVPYTDFNTYAIPTNYTWNDTEATVYFRCFVDSLSYTTQSFEARVVVFEK